MLYMWLSLLVSVGNIQLIHCTMQQSLQKMGWLGARSGQVPYILLQGAINNSMTQRVDYLLEKMPSSASKLAVVITSFQGSYSQAHIIAQKLRDKAAYNNIQLITFASGAALDPAFLVLMAGQQVYAGNATYVGSIEHKHSKFTNQTYSKFISTVSYANRKSIVEDFDSDEPLKESPELEATLGQFAQTTNQMIRQRREGKIAPETRLNKFYTASEAHKLGIIDGVGRLHTVLPEQVHNCRIDELRFSRWDMIKFWAQAYKNR